MLHAKNEKIRARHCRGPTNVATLAPVNSLIFPLASLASLAPVASLAPLAIVTFLFLIPPSARPAESNDKPNLIYIMADDLGYGDLGCFGQKTIQTPQLDKLAADGIKLTSYYAGNTVCRPSRLSLWTGQHTGHTAISSNGSYIFKPGDHTVAESLNTAGYATGGVGKWALGDTTNTGHPNHNGFDFWMGYLDQGLAHNFYPTHLWRNREQVVLPGNVLITDDPAARGRVSKERKTYSHDVMTDEALDFVRRNAENPFLLHIHWTIPHANNEGGRVLGDGMEVPDYGIYQEKDWPSTKKGAAAMITRMDTDVGRLVDLLTELKLEKKTLIVFTSDNGPHSEGGHKHEVFDANGPLRGFKRDLYEGGIRVPTIAWWPGVIKPGSSSDEPLAAWDWFPTACELAGATAPADAKLDGLSFAPLLRGEKQKSHDFLFWKYGKKIAIRQGQWKALKTSDKAAIELYNLDEDIGEKNNLAKEHPEKVAELKALMTKAQQPSN